MESIPCQVDRYHLAIKSARKVCSSRIRCFISFVSFHSCLYSTSQGISLEYVFIFRSFLSNPFLESESRSVMSNPLQPHELSSPWNSPGQNTGVGSPSLLQQIFPTQDSNWGLLHCRQILYQLSYQESPYKEEVGNK